MTRDTIRSVVVSTVLAATLVAPRAGAQAGGAGFATDQVVVRLLSGGDIDFINLLFGTIDLATIAGQPIYLLQVPMGDDPEALVSLLESVPEVQWAELNYLLATMDGTTGTFFVSVDQIAYENQYALDQINPADVGTPGTTVGVLDTGVDAEHPVLAGRVVSGFDFVDFDTDPDDAGDGVDDDGDGDIDELVGHGTHIAGVVALVCANADILPVRVLDGDGTGFSFQAAQGIFWAIEQGAGVINLSFVTDSDSNALNDAVAAAEQAGATVVAAAGNLDQSQAQYPAGNAATISVAATDQCLHKSPFSNYGAHIVISAPGTAIVGTVPGGGFGSANGTSLAAALVSGGAATLRSALPKETAAQVRARLTDWAVALDPYNPQYEGMLGAGRIDIGAALEQASDPGCADSDGDGAVGITDLLDLLGAWGENPGHAADSDGDCVVGIADLLALVAQWGPCD